MIVRVTQSDIDNGIPGDGSCCAIALAMNRMGYVASIDEDIFLARPYFSDDVSMLRPSEDAKDFINRFDDDPEECEPCELELFEMEG